MVFQLRRVDCGGDAACYFQDERLAAANRYEGIVPVNDNVGDYRLAGFNAAIGGREQIW